MSTLWNGIAVPVWTMMIGPTYTRCVRVASGLFEVQSRTERGWEMKEAEGSDALELLFRQVTSRGIALSLQDTVQRIEDSLSAGLRDTKSVESDTDELLAPDEVERLAPLSKEHIRVVNRALKEGERVITSMHVPCAYHAALVVRLREKSWDAKLMKQGVGGYESSYVQISGRLISPGGETPP